MRLLADDKILFRELKRYLRDSMPQCANTSIQRVLCQGVWGMRSVRLQRRR